MFAIFVKRTFSHEMRLFNILTLPRIALHGRRIISTTGCRIISTSNTATKRTLARFYQREGTMNDIGEEMEYLLWLATCRGMNG